jgi:mono/diheme cytochrome c family protein
LTKQSSNAEIRVLSSAGADNLKEGEMLRSILALCSAIAFSIGTAFAETPLERGSYLVNSIMACGNCHTPKNAGGEPIADKELAGGLSFSPPPFTATASNITPDPDTGIGKWTDDEIKRAITEGVRPSHGRLPGVPLAAIMAVNFFKALLPRDLDAVVVYLRSVKPIRSIKRRFTMTHTPMQRRDSLKRHYAIQFAGALTWSRSDIAWSVIRLERKAFQIT